MNHRTLAEISLRNLSFWAGLLIGLFLGWLLPKLRLWLPKVKAFFKNRQASARENLAAGTEGRYRDGLGKAAQSMHLAAPLFSLDEILIEPRLIAPPRPQIAGLAQPPAATPEKPSGPRAATPEPAFSLPYLPDYPELALAFQARTISLKEALQSGQNLAITGAPGAGKSFALAYLASRVVYKAEEVGLPPKTLPVLAHAADIPIQLQVQRDPAELIAEAAGMYAPRLLQARMPAVFAHAFQSGKALLLLDGLDELPADLVENICGVLGALLKKYPRTRLVVAAATEFTASLPSLGLVPVGLAPWNTAQKTAFLTAWGRLWMKHITKSEQVGPGEADPLLLNQWLLSQEQFSSPLETTLKAWAAYAGDTQGPSLSQALEAYLRRMTAGLPEARISLGKLAAYMVEQACHSIDRREAQQFLGGLARTSALVEAAQPGTQPDQKFPPVSPGPAEKEAASPSGAPRPASPTPADSLLRNLIERGLLVERSGGRLSFNHVLPAAFLAAAAMPAPDDWDRLIGTGGLLKNQTLRFLAARQDLTPLVQVMLADKDDPLRRKTFQVGAWLREAPKNARWRAIALRELAGLLPKDFLPLPQRLRAIAALVASGDPGVALLLRQMLDSPSNSVRLAAILGVGMARDAKSIDKLIDRMASGYPVEGQVAAIALIMLGTRPALDAVASMLLHGSDEMRRAAAEALALEPDEGCQALKEGITMEDVHLRRASVYGLGKLEAPWATEILEKLQLEDKEWVVRSAAAQVLEDQRLEKISLPQPLPPLWEAAWMIEFAAKQGMGVTPGKPAQNLLMQALKTGEAEQRLAAIETLKARPDSAAVPTLYSLLYGPQGELQDAAFEALWSFAAAGINLPSPARFGLG